MTEVLVKPGDRAVVGAPHLRGFDGHYFDYCNGLISALIETGQHVVLVGNELGAPQQRETKFDPSFFIGPLVQPLAKTRRRLAAGTGRKVVNPEFLVSLRRELRSRTRSDCARCILLQPSALELREILSWEESLACGQLSIIRFSHFPDGVRELKRLQTRLEEFWAAGGDVRVFADTIGLASELSDHLGHSVRPIGVPLLTQVDCPLCERDREDFLVVGYAGNARLEKGYNLLPPIVDACADLLNAGNLKFRIQSNCGATSDRWAVRQINKYFAGTYTADQVELVNGPLDSSAFSSLVSSLDIVLLPYDRSEYRVRSSGLFVEAMARNIPVLVAEGTWMESELNGRGIAYSTTDSASYALRELIAGYDQYRKRFAECELTPTSSQFFQNLVHRF